MTVWKKYENEERYAVAIYNFTPATTGPQLPLEVGELVQLLGETTHWYWGKSLRRKGEGALPKNYVMIRDCTVEQCGEVKVVTAGGGGVAHDIALTLRQWLHRWKNLYISNDDHFKFMEVSMRALIELRAEAASGNLPQDQLRRVTRTAIFTIDKGNRTIGMDLAVRNSNGQPVDPSAMSTYELNSLHEEANSRLEKNMESTPMAPGSTSSSAARACSISVRVHNLVCRGTELCVCWLALHNSRGNRITEHATPSHTPTPQAHILFTDLGNDIKKEKVYLVCYVVRIGGMEPQNIDIRRQSLVPSPIDQSSSTGNMKRPFGIACADISKHLVANDPDKHVQLPFFACEKDNFDTLLRKIIANRELKEAKHSQGLWVSLQLIEGDLKQIREEHPHLILGNTLVARKMGFPEVILPGDARNDLYVTVVSGSFSKGKSKKGGKSSERNIELSARLVDKHGKTIPNVISIGAGVPLVSEYTSIVYYHEDRPRWQEVFKVCLNIEEFKEAHIVFFYRHRSSNEAKDRQEVRFAMSYLKLMQRDGTTTNDMQHNLCVYKIDTKHCSDIETESSALCLALPAHKHDLPAGAERGLKRGPLSLVHRDVLTVETRLCSTKLTQREEILGILKWGYCRAENTLRSALTRLLSVPADELIKFLQDILDALFAILTQVEDDTESYHEQSYAVLVLDCLLRVISIVSDHKFQHFQPVLMLYIDNSFCDTMVYEKLLSVMVWVITSAEQGELALKRLLQCMKCLECLTRIVARSRQLRRELSDVDTEHDFRAQFENLLEALVWLMRCGEHALTCQGSALKYWPHALVHAVKVYPHTDASIYTVKALNALPLSRLAKQRVLALRDLVKGPLCKKSSARSPLLLHAATAIASLLKAKNEVELCIETIGEIMSLFSRDTNVEGERAEVVHRLLPTVMRCCAAMMNDKNYDDDPSLQRRTVCVLLDMVRQMTPEEYAIVAKALESEGNGVIVCQALSLIVCLLERSVFSAQWAAMLQLQLRCMLHALKLISTTLLDRLNSNDPAELSATINFMKEWFLACAALASHAAIHRASDVRRALPHAMLGVWDSLRTNKILFLPSSVGPFLEVSFLKDEEVRAATIPVLFDMMQTQYEYSVTSGENEDNPLKNLENELIDKLDVIVERGSGDVQWRAKFVTVCGGLADRSNSEFRSYACALIAACARQLDALLDYRAADGKLHRMHLTTGVLKFYQEIARPAQYIRYVHKLAQMHVESSQWAEAGLCLKLHAELLQWSDDPLPDRLKLPDVKEDTHCTHMGLKEHLYSESAELLHRGHQWELAVMIVKELVRVCEEKLVGYDPLVQLHTKLAELYTAIQRIPRSHPQYFRVSYYGKGFPTYMRSQYGFVYRGNEYEQLQEFVERMLDEWPTAEVLTKLDPPGVDITEGEGQYLQINSIYPEMCEKRKRLSGKSADSQILQYYTYNEVDKFVFSRPYYKAEESIDGSTEDIAGQNEFATRWLERTELETSDKLPGIVRWSRIIEVRTFHISPIQAAVEELTNVNEKLKQLIKDAKEPDSPLPPLTMRLKGMLDPAVMGGIVNYEKAFLTHSYLERHPEHEALREKLLDLIVEEIPILKYGLEVHKSRIPAPLEALHDHLQHCFYKIQQHVHQRYGRKTTVEFEPDTPEVQLRITLRDSLASPGSKSSQNRISDVSSGNDSTSKSRFIISAINPLASRNSSGVTNYFGTIQYPPKRRLDKRKRDRKSEIGTSSSSSQWYTVSSPNGSVANNTFNNSCNSNFWPSEGSPLKELRQELITERPLRSEAEKERRLSQRTSLINSSAPTSNRNSMSGTTDSNQEEEEPPPLPQKSSHRSLEADSDHNDNVVLTPRYNYDTVISPRGSFLYNSQRKAMNIEKAPTPPPKMKNKSNHK